MNLKKIFYLSCLGCLISLSGCQNMPDSVQSLGTSLNNGIKALNEMAAQADNSATDNSKTRMGSNKGIISGAQCQNSKGKTKSNIEQMIGLKLTDDKAYSLNSLGATYNIGLSDVFQRGNTVDMAGRPAKYAAICSLTLEGNKPNSKVIHWSIIN